MRNRWAILLLLLILPLSAKDPMGRGKSTFATGKSYPQVNISGFEELEFNSLEQSGEPEKYQNTAEYTNLPASVRVYDGLRHRRLIDLEGQISEKLYVRYKIAQDPDLPQETDIYVEYDRFSVYFGKYDASLVNGELFSMNKNIDGLHMDFRGDNFELEGIYGEERSHEREFSFNGAGKREYSLGQANIQEGTLKVRLNGEDVAESDYRVDYFDGVIIFNKILSTLDRVEGSYEYLDPIEDFLPISSKVRLSGVQHRYRNYRGVEARLVTAAATQRYEPPEKKPAQSLPENLASATDFQYAGRNIIIKVNSERVKAVYLRNDVENIPFKQEAGAWTLNFPSSPGERELSLAYEFSEYTLLLDYLVNFAEQTVDDSANFFGPLRAEDQILVKKYLPEVKISANHQVRIPEGTVVFTQDKFKQDSRLRFVFYPDRAYYFNGVEARFRDSKQDLTFTNDSYALEYALSNADPVGENNCYLLFNYGPEAVMRKIPFVVDYGDDQPENLERMQLTEFPLHSFSEKVYFSGRLLEQNQDYRINYTTGVITFLRPVPANTWDLSVEYVYNQTRAVQEIIKGDETQGPYKLANNLIVPGSVTVIVNNLSMLEGTDYKLDDAAGTLSFSRKIHSVDTIQISYKYYISITPAADQRRERFSISSYFVQEQAKSAEAESADAYTLSGAELSVASDSTEFITTINIPVKYLPIVVNSLKLYINGSAPTASLAVSVNEYLGEIVIKGNDSSEVYSADDLQVTFDQAKTAIAPKAYFSGNNNMTIILDEIISNMPRPIVYESMILEVKTRDSIYYTPLVYKRDYIMGYSWDLSANARDGNGNAVFAGRQEAWQRGIITFVTNNGNVLNGYTTYSGFSQDDQFRLTYKISDSESTDPGDVMHQTYGTKFSYSPVDWLRTDVEYNESRKRYQRTMSNGFVTANGDGSSQQMVQLPVDEDSELLEVVEDSERVYVNDRLLTKNDHYSITYKGGLVRFRAGLVLNPEDRIQIEYQYYSSGAGTEEAIMETAKAAKVGATIDLGRTDISAGYVTVDSKYDPVGNPSGYYPAGTEAQNIIINSQPIDRMQLYSRLEKQNTLKGTYDDETMERYQNTVLQNYRAAYGFNTNDSIALAYNRTDVNLPAPSMNRSYYETDTRQQDYQMDLNFGPETIRTGISLKNAEFFEDELDKDNGYRSYNRNTNVTNFFQPLRYLSFSSSYARNIDDQFREDRVQNESTAYSEIVRFNPWTIDSSFEYSGADYTNARSVSNSYEELATALGRDRRQVFNISFRRPPELASALYEELYLHYDQTYSNRAVDLYNQAPDISRLNNFSAGLRPYDLVTLGFEDRYSRNLLENYGRADLYQENIYRFTRFYPAKYISMLPDDFLIVNKIEYSRKFNENARNIMSGGTEQTYSLDNYTNLVQNYSLNPLDALTMELEFSNYNVERFSDIKYTTGYSYTESVEPENKQLMRLHYALPSLLGLQNINYAWQMDMSQKRLSKTTLDQLGAYSRLRDDLDSNNNAMDLVYSYLDNFRNTHSLDTMEEFRRKTDEGTRYSFGQSDYLAVRYDIPFTGFGLTYGFTRVYNSQFSRMQDIIGKNTLTKDAYDNKLLRHDNTQQYMVDYTPVTWLTFDASMYFRSIDQQIVSRDVVTRASLKYKDVIGSKSYEAGVTYKPMADLSMRYGWRQNIFEQGYGEETRFTAKYTPLRFELGELSYDYTNICTYGKGTNDPQQDDSLNSLHGFVQTSVVERDDIMVRNNLVFRVNQNISNIIIDNMVVDINLTRLHFWDKINDSYSYSLNAFYAKGTINF